MNILGIFYLIGCFIALIIGIYDFYKNVNDVKYHEFGMLAPMILMSWITVLCYIYGKIRYKRNISE